MDTSQHNMTNLFMQLGLENTPEGIRNFISNHRLSDDIDLIDAPFWNTAQRNFLKESFRQDADWVMTIDELNTQLRD